MPIRIAVDVMGGDYAPDQILAGVSEALEMYGDKYQLFLAGPEQKIQQYLQEHGLQNDPRVEIVDAPEVVEMDEHPANAVRNKRHSSIMECANLMKEKRVDAIFSAGNTGAAVAASHIRCRRLPGIDRPGIATQLPTEKESFVLMDSGATVDCTPAMLVEFAVMGAVYAEKILGRKNPRVALLSNGTEETKGCSLVQETYKLMKEIPHGLNFVGNVEGHGLFSGDTDVVICDGFVGNVVLKTSEQLAKAIGHIVKRNMKSNLLWMVGGLLSKGAYGELKRKTDYAEFGGAPLLGINGVCMIGHGISDARAVRNGIRASGDFVQMGVNDEIVRRMDPLTSYLAVGGV